MYKHWSKSGRLPAKFGGGLCLNVPQDYFHTISLFQPTIDEKWEWLRDEGLSHIFWGNEKPYPKGEGIQEVIKIRRRFNSFRKTVVLLICAMHNEL